MVSILLHVIGIWQSKIDILTGNSLTPAENIFHGTLPNTASARPEGPHVYLINGTYYLLIAEGKVHLMVDAVTDHFLLKVGLVRTIDRQSNGVPHLPALGKTTRKTPSCLTGQTLHSQYRILAMPILSKGRTEDGGALH